MKNKLLIIFGTLLLAFIILNINLIEAECVPQINLISQDPVPATPGSYVKVVFEVSNLDGCDTGFSVRLNPEYPFSLDNGTDLVQTVQIINGFPYVSGSYKTAWDVGYKIRIADDAAGENYTLSLSSTSSDFTSFSVKQDFNISIIDERTTFDSVIQETSGSTVSIAIANTGKYAANSVIVKIPEQDNFETSGTNGQMVGNLASGDYTIVSFDIVSKAGFSGTGIPPTSKNSQLPNIQNQSSSSGSNGLNFEIYYTDNLGIRRIVNMQLPLSLSNNSTGSFRGGMQQRSSWSVWYTILIILGILVIGFILYKKFPKQAKKFISKVNIFKGKKQQNYSPITTEVPEWVKKEKEKEKKK